jgi:hypothetical protein
MHDDGSWHLWPAYIVCAMPLLQNLELTQQLSAEAAKPGNVNVLQGPFLMIGNEPLATLMQDAALNIWTASQCCTKQHYNETFDTLKWSSLSRV